MYCCCEHDEVVCIYMNIIEFLKMPETRQTGDFDDPHATMIHAKVIQKKVFLKKLYRDCYKELYNEINGCEGKVIVEVGSGGGFIKEVISNAITSDIMELSNVDKVFSATEMPFGDGSVDVFFLNNVLHHIKDVRFFFTEAVRCLKTSGRIVMIEPANTLFSRFVYKNYHHEDFDVTAGWLLKNGGPLTTGNGALPWIIFYRDRHIFEEQFSLLKIVKVRIHTPLRYLLSGGLTYRQLVPSCCYSIIKTMERMLSPLNGMIGMFQTIVLEKR